MFHSKEISQAWVSGKVIWTVVTVSRLIFLLKQALLENAQVGEIYKMQD